MKTQRNALSWFFSNMSWRRIRTASSTPISPNFASGTASSNHNNSSVSMNQSKFKKSSNDLDDALNLFHQMVHTRPLPCVIHFNKLLCRIVKLKRYSVVVSLFQEMRIKGIPISVRTINILVDVYCRSSRVDCGFCLLGVVFKCGFEFNVVTFTTLIKGLFMDNKIVEAIGLFKKLVRENVYKVDQITYGTVINGLCKAGHTQNALDLLAVMQKEGPKPDTIAYNTVIDSLCKDRMVDQALGLLSEMIEIGVPPDIFTYTSLIQGLCNFNRWKEVTEGFFLVGRCSAALELFQEMLDAGHKPDFYTSCVLLSGLCDNGLVEQAMSVYHQLDRNGNGSHVYDTIIIDKVCKMGQLNIARNVFNELISKGRRLDVYTYNVMINGLCRGGFLDEALELLRKMEKNDCLPNTATYNVILQEFVREKKWHEANLLLDEMVGKGISPNHCTFFFINDLLALKTGDETVLKVIQKFAANHVK